MVLIGLREPVELQLTAEPPPTGDGFFYPNLEQLVVLAPDPELREAEKALEQGRFQDCEDKVNQIHDACSDDATRGADALRLLWHCFRCCGRSRGGLLMAEEQRQQMSCPVSSAKMALSMAEMQLALGEAAEALKLATEAHKAFRSADLPSFEGFCLLVMASATSKTAKAEEWCQEAIEVFQVDGHSHGLGRALLQLSEVTGKTAEANKALDVFKYCEDVRWQAYSLQKMALLYWNQDDPENAVKKAEACMSLLENHQLMDLKREAPLVELLCAANLRLNLPEEALRSLRGCLSRARKQGERSIEGHMMYCGIGPGKAISGAANVLKTAESCREIFEELGDRRMEVAALCAQSELFLEGDHLKDALGAAQQAMMKAKEIGEADPLCSAALALCHVRRVRKEPRAALDAVEMAVQSMPSVQSRLCMKKLTMQHAKILMEMEDYTSAGQIMFEAHKDCQHHGDWKGAASALMMLSRVQMQRGKDQEAMRAAQQASELFRSVDDRLSEADALLLMSQAARRSMLSYPADWSFIPDFMPGLQAAKDALAIAQHFDENLLKAFAQLALAHIEVLSKDFLKVAYEHAEKAAETFSEAGLAEELAWSLEVQGFASYHLGCRVDAVEAIEKAKAAFQQVPGKSCESHLRRCDATLKEMKVKEKDVVVPDNEETKAPALRMPAVLQSQAAERREPRPPREVKDLSMLHGKELIEAQLMNIMEDLGAENIELDLGFQSAGLTSRAAVQMKSELEQTFGDLRYPSTLAFDYPNIRLMSEWLMDAQEQRGAIAG